MSGMVERVALAVRKNRYERTQRLTPHEEDLDDARVAIRALREPTEAMVKGAPDLRDVDFYPSDVYRAMIDAALLPDPDKPV